MAKAAAVDMITDMKSTSTITIMSMNIIIMSTRSMSTIITTTNMAKAAAVDMITDMKSTSIITMTTNTEKAVVVDITTSTDITMQTKYSRA